MSEEEAAGFLESERVVVCATNGRRGWPHLMPLWYVLRDPEEGGASPRLWGWTYAKSQKARNLERDCRATLQVESGTAYEELRGLMLETEVALHRDPDGTPAIALDPVARYSRRGNEFAAVRDFGLGPVPNRGGRKFRDLSRLSWVDRGLAGSY